MNVRSLILRKLHKQASLTSAEIVKATGFSREYVGRFFRELVREGKIVLLGKANQARYVLRGAVVKRAMVTPLATRRQLKNWNLNEDTVLREIEHSSAVLAGVPSNIRRIVEYAFTEMLNNAIEHSKSKVIVVTVACAHGVVKFEVVDRGVGIFNSIRAKRRLKNTLEAIQDLLKGKQTTAPRQHTGEGIFFTSKVADVFTIQSSGKKLIFNNLVRDIFIRNIKFARGTKVIFLISIKSKRQLQEVFRIYTGTAYGFSKTRVVVKLYELGSEYISRSQARRVVAGLEKFKHVILDFGGVNTVGQGFTDEVFRVWHKQHPGINLEVENADENARFMIFRAQEKT